MMKAIYSSTLSISIYILGILLGITLSTLATWADYESTSYGFISRAKTPFHGLSCPILMTRDETQTIKVRLTNSTGRNISPSIRTELSTTLIPDSKLEFFELAPGESLLVERTINSENIDLGQFIFVKAAVFSANPLPDQESTCGVFILPMHGSGLTILVIAAFLSILLISGGMFLLHKSDTLKKHFNPLLFIAIITLLAMIFSFSGLWIQSALFLVLAILTSFIVLSIVIR